MLMSAVGFQKLVTRELMVLTGVRRCLSIRAFDATREQHVLRWFGGGKTVGMRIPGEASAEEATRYARAASEEWRAAEAGPDDDTEYEWLKSQAEAAGMGWWQETYDPTNGEESG